MTSHFVKLLLAAILKRGGGGEGKTWYLSYCYQFLKDFNNIWFVCSRRHVEVPCRSLQDVLIGILDEVNDFGLLQNGI